MCSSDLSMGTYELIVRWYWALGPEAIAEELGGKWTPSGVRRYARHLGVDIPGRPGYIRLRVAARVIGGGKRHSQSAARVIYILARRDGVLAHDEEGVPLVPTPWIWEVELEVLDRVFKDDEAHARPTGAMSDEDVRLLITRYLHRTGDWGGAEELWEAHLSWRRANGLPPAGEVSRAGGGGGVLPGHGHVGGRGAHRR